MNILVRLSVIVCLLASFIYPQQGKYTRKSVSSLESVWVKDGVSNFDYKTFDKFIDFYVEVERFDYNVLPNKMLKDFRSEAKSKSEITPETLAEVLESTVVTKIVEILNNPDVVKNRGKALKDESALKRFAATKAKSLGLTADELGVLMNSAYIYLPFITSMEQTVEENIVSIEMNGGLIWWQIKNDGDGNVTVEQILSAETMAMSSADKSATNPLTKKSVWPKDFGFGNDKWKVGAEQYAQNDAMLAFAKNLGVKTKKIDAFKLTAQIAEADGKEYGFPLGFREGVHLDDGFDLVEYSEDEEGNEIADRVGFVRVSKTGNNIDDPSSFTYSSQLLGDRQDIGGVVMEHPVLGLDARVKVGMITGLNIPKASMYNPLTGDQYFAEDMTSALGVDVDFKYNVAPIIGISQTFLDMSFGVAMPAFSYSNIDASGATVATLPTVAPFMVNFYGGASKKLWFGSSNLTLGGGVGIESINVAGKVSYSYLGTTYGDIDYAWSAMSVAFKFGADFEKMITPDLSVNLGLAYKMALAPSAVSKKWGDNDPVSYTELDYATYDLNMNYHTWESDGISDIALGGMAFSLGVNYALGELPINLFGFLDPFKKH